MFIALLRAQGIMSFFMFSQDERSESIWDIITTTLTHLQTTTLMTATKTGHVLAWFSALWSLTCLSNLQADF
jgi:uncharacterized membrane protein YjjB (DUF3815 family)